MDLAFLNGLDIEFTPGAMLKDFTTFRLGGACPVLITCRRAQDLAQTILRLRENNIHFILMGFGSNTLVSDNGVDALIVRYSTDNPVVTPQGDRLTVDASTQLDDLVVASIQHNLEGLTTFSGIPGTVGGAIAGNAGAYGFEISGPLVELTLLKPDNTVVTVPKESISFSYRNSDIKHNGDIILSAVFQLKPGKDPQAMMKAHDTIIANRCQKHGNWREHPSAGSFFRNVEPTSKAGPRQSAGWFLEQAGAKHLNINGAHPYPMHANIITHEDNTTAQSVYDLSLKMAGLVKIQFGFDLIREVRLMGEFENAPGCVARGYW